MSNAQTQCLLVLPNLQINQPTYLTPRVAITNLDTDHIRASLVRMTRR